LRTNIAVHPPQDDSELNPMDDVHLITGIALAADDFAFFVDFSEKSEVVSHVISPADPGQLSYSIGAEIRSGVGITSTPVYL
jgi:hypothetical protein